jgi:hypothetical protein
MKTLKEMVGTGRIVTFERYRAGVFYYKTECGFEFPVPATDIGDATLAATDKAMLFMRWIRKHREAVETNAAA